MGATYCCSQDERKSTSYKAYINNLQLTGVDNLGDLDQSTISSKFKNMYEKN